MYKVREEKKNILKAKRTGYYAKKCGTSVVHISNVLNGHIGCSEMSARCIVSVLNEIPLSDERLEDLLEEYFRKE